jgi:gamma-glutamyl-gamma-aminobutyrate hydrolase PuuD
MPRPGRIGVTMRVAAGREPGGTARDVFPEDWRDTLASVLPAASWWPLANTGAAAVRRFTALRLDALLLAGGNDLGSAPQRDDTELRLVDHCASRGIPVLGVCRGLQLVQTCFGGGIVPAPEAHDAGRLHRIDVTDDRAQRLLGVVQLAAPSYHRFGVPAGSVAPALETWATSDDGFVEMLAHRSLPIVAVQWHPERPLPEPEIARRLLRGFADAR